MSNSVLTQAISIDELVSQFDELSRRVRVIEGRAGIAAPSDQARLTAVETALATQVAAGAGVAVPAPAAVSQTIVLYDVGWGDSIYSANANIMSGSFTSPRAGTVVFEGQLDCRAEYWDNFVAGPWRRGVGTVITPASSTETELAGGDWGSGPRATITKRDSVAVGAGASNAYWRLGILGGNQIHVYSGWLRVTFTG